MVEGKRVAVVVPAFQEEFLVADTIRGIPDFVDLIVVVDDHSADATVENARATGDPRLEVIEHAENQGVGGAIATGYARCREFGIDVTCVMAADNQMDPAELATLVAQDWTAGCIALATDADIEAVAAWVRRQEVRNVRLVP